MRTSSARADIGEIALGVLTRGEAISAIVLDKPMPGKMTGYSGPERNRSEFRKRQSVPIVRLFREPFGRPMIFQSGKT
jgi:hypothetical protein